MIPENDYLLSRLAVRIDDADTKLPIGSGVLFNHPDICNSVYLLTASHCLYEDKETLEKPLQEVIIKAFNPNRTEYQSLRVSINHELVSRNVATDVAIIYLDKEQIEPITGPLPIVQAIKERQSIKSFVLKGFPSATNGQELVMTRPKFVQSLEDKKIFQLCLTDDFTTDTSDESKVDGFSGSGIFLEDNNRVYLFGIFTRFREAQKIIYCQYLEPFNELLANVFLPTIPFSYIGAYGLNPDFFSRYNTNAIKNLGPRFSKQLNLRLPIVQAFHDVAKDKIFELRLSQCIDKWLMHKCNSSVDEKGVLVEIIKEVDLLKQSVITWITTISWDADKKIDLSFLHKGLDVLKHNIDTKQNQLYELQREDRKKEKTTQEKNNFGYNKAPYEDELSWLRETERAFYTLTNSLNEVSVELANSPILIIKGDPGSGKSHLLGDITNEATRSGKAAFLFLGQLFHRGQTIWQNILNQLGLTCSPNELLISLNNIGKQQGSRVLLMIDALNEGGGKELWKEALAGFIEEVKRYPFIGLVMSVRSTYFNSIIPKVLIDDPQITYKVHEGFKGNEYAALRLFCEHYGLQTPNFPILAPEFTNPLFLQLICQGLKSSGEKTFPQGFQGITKIFNYYLVAVYEKLLEKREEYEHRKYVISEAIDIFAKSCYEKKDVRMLTIEEADRLFSKSFANFPHLLNDLIHENVFIQTSHKDYHTDKESEMLFFSYERFGDYFIAAQLLSKYEGGSDVKIAFRKQGELGELINNDQWTNRGILEAMAVQLPEKYGLEIIEVFDWAFALSEEPDFYHINGTLTRLLWDSLKWRDASNINDEVIINFLRSKDAWLSQDEFFFGLMELAMLHDHPFNSDRLFKNLNHYSMPDRDSFWQKHMLSYSLYNDYDVAFPIRRLIDWAWQKGISALIDAETARLVGQTLAWILSSTYRRLRDQATKAMVNLLEEQTDALIQIMNKFKNINDSYIKERLFAVAYGCALRTSTDKNLKKIASYIYSNTFKKGEPPVHVLIRDYARNIIEYACYKGLASRIDMTLVRPPYKSSFPDRSPSKEDVEEYNPKFDDSDQPLERNKKRIFGQIHFSTIDCDFGNHTVENAVRGFSAINFRTEQRYKDFKKQLKGNRKYLMQIFESSIGNASVWEDRRINGGKMYLDKTIDAWIEESQNKIQQSLSRLKKEFNDAEIKQLTEIFQPFLFAKYLTENSTYGHSFDANSAKYWIVQRAFELGYDIKKHYEYDKQTERLEHYRYDYYGSNIERIGKKYQWIALHEIVALLGDNYYFSEDRWNSRTKFTFFDGPWQQHLRDIDPVFISKDAEEDNIEDVNVDNNDKQKLWWFDSKYEYWDQAPLQWVNNLQDIPKPENIVLRKDENSEDWLYLDVHTKWEEPKNIGEDNYKRSQKVIGYMIQSYIVKKAEKKKIIEYLKNKNFWGRWMPEPDSVNLSTFNRENYWSPAATMDNKRRKIWEPIRDTRFKIIVTTNEAVGEMSKDKSGAHFSYKMPCKTLFDGMGLQYAKEDGSFRNNKGEIVVKHISPLGIMIRKRDFFSFLESKGYDIVWTLLGEKFVMNNKVNDGNDYFRVISGVYQLDNEKPVGHLFLSERY
ncbi:MULTISPECIES: AVAST type 2 anti-phage system protein Avs2 [Chitinophagaceae]